MDRGKADGLRAGAEREKGRQESGREATVKEKSKKEEWRLFMFALGQRATEKVMKGAGMRNTFSWYHIQRKEGSSRCINQCLAFRAVSKTFQTG